MSNKWNNKILNKTQSELNIISLKFKLVYGFNRLESPCKPQL